MLPPKQTGATHDEHKSQVLRLTRGKNKKPLKSETSDPHAHPKMERYHFQIDCLQGTRQRGVSTYQVGLMIKGKGKKNHANIIKATRGAAHPGIDTGSEILAWALSSQTIRKNQWALLRSRSVNDKVLVPIHTPSL